MPVALCVINKFNLNLSFWICVLEFIFKAYVIPHYCWLYMISVHWSFILFFKCVNSCVVYILSVHVLRVRVCLCVFLCVFLVFFFLLFQLMLLKNQWKCSYVKCMNVYVCLTDVSSVYNKTVYLFIAFLSSNDLQQLRSLDCMFCLLLRCVCSP